MRAMWDSVVPDKEEIIAVNIGCSDAVAREAAPSSANVTLNDNIMQRMPLKAVNLVQAASAMGRGSNYHKNGELGQ